MAALCLRVSAEVCEWPHYVLECLPAGIIDSAEAQMKLNLNEWVCMDMNVC